MENIETKINFQALFEAVPGLFLVLKPNAPHFTIVAANDAYLKATMTERKKIIGRDLFDIFPDNPNDSAADGARNLKRSLTEVLKNKTAHKMAIQKYDIQRPEAEGGGFEERHWSPLNSPLLNKNNAVEYIIHRVEDVTEFILLNKKNTGEITTARAELDKKSLLIESNQKRINAILEVLLKYTILDFSEHIPITENADELDAIAVGLNTLSEELVSHIQQLRESEDRYHNMVEEVEDYAILLLDKDGCIQNWNKGVKKIKGYDTDEVLGENYRMFYPAEAREKKLPEKLLEKAAAKGKAVEEGWRIRKDGTLFWAHVVLTALHDDENNVIGFSKVTRDLTALKEAEEKLQTSQKIFSTVFFKSPIINAITDAKTGQFIEVNENFIEFCGYTKEEIINRSSLELDLIPDPKHREEIIRTIKEKGYSRDILMEIRNKGGETKWVSSSAHAVSINDRDCFITAMIDVTERKKAEDQLQIVNKELEAFSYSVSHDLRAPLRAIDGYAKILEEDYGKILDEEGNRLLEVVQYNAKKMGTLIDDLLAFSRLGKKELTKTTLNMNELVEGALYELNKSVQHKAKVKIKHLHKARGDYGLINQVVVNLLSNAIKYSAKVEKPHIEISSENKGTEIVYSVKDNGAGFDMRYVNKLFGVFQRLHTMDEFEGTGVGLAIVQRILSKHGGKVSAQGEKDKGATFKFSLPAN